MIGEYYHNSSGHWIAAKRRLNISCGHGVDKKKIMGGGIFDEATGHLEERIAMDWSGNEIECGMICLPSS